MKVRTPRGFSTIVVSSIDVPEVNYGLNKPPVATNNASASTANPGGMTQVLVPGLSANDPEQGALVLTGNSVKIETLPSAATGLLYYDGLLVTAGQIITMFDPSKLKVDPTDGSQTMVFTFSVLDAAG